MNQLLCSTGALITARNDRNYRLLPEAAERIRCDGFEFMMSRAWYDSWEQVSGEVEKMGLSFPLFHVDKSIGERISRDEAGDNETARKLFAINCKFARRIGSNKLVLHLWGGLPSDRNIKRNIETYAALNETAQAQGLLLTVENVVCNQAHPLLHLEALRAAYPEIAFTFDVRFAKFHDQLERAFTDEYAWLWDAVRHIHISDYAGGYMEWGKTQSLHPGEGRIDFEELFGDLMRVGYSDTITVESTSVLPDGQIDYEKLNRTLDYLRELMQ